MATVGNQIKFVAGTYAQYVALAAKNADTIYFCQDTNQIFVGESEYTKGTKTLNAAPTAATEGLDGVLYAYNGALYLCQVTGGTYNWTRVANVNDFAGTVTSITVGEGLDKASEDSNPITTTGTIKHAVPTGASAITDEVTDQTPGFGGYFNIQTASTDKFGHVTALNSHKVTLPDETAVAVSNADPAPDQQTLNFGDTFSVITGVAKGTNSHDLVQTVQVFKLPESDNNDTTYTISSAAEGRITLTPSEGEAQTIDINGWSDLAKKSDITAVFKYKGTVATVEDLPEETTEGLVTGDVYFVSADNSEYVFNSAAATGKKWEKLGPVIDLSGYANRADVIGRVTGATGEVAKFNADGELESTGFTLGCSVPADAKFTDTVYTHPSFTEHESGLYKITVNDEGHVSAAAAVETADIKALNFYDKDEVDAAIGNASIKWGGME